MANTIEQFILAVATTNKERVIGGDRKSVV